MGSTQYILGTSSPWGASYFVCKLLGAPSAMVFRTQSFRVAPINCPLRPTSCSKLKVGTALHRCPRLAPMFATDGAHGYPVHEVETKPGRVANVKRETKETKVEVSLTLDGTGVCTANTPVHFLNHMLDQLASHGLFNVMVDAEGDTWIDDHHTCEDIALALGSALAQALGDRKGIHRFGDFTAPLDEALVHVVLDLSGRPHLTCLLDIPSERIGTFDTQMVEHFFQSMVNTSGMTLHIRQLDGKNSHHIVEATFKAFARALRQAVEYDPRREGQIASSKGVLTQK